MARNRTATSVLRQRGSFEAHPEREVERKDEPVPNGELGLAPHGLTELQLACWNELVAMAPNGVLADSDRWVVEVAARIMARLRKDSDLPSSQWSTLISCLAKMGLSPADRSKVKVVKDEKDEDEKFFGEEKSAAKYQ